MAIYIPLGTAKKNHGYWLIAKFSKKKIESFLYNIFGNGFIYIFVEKQGNERKLLYLPILDHYREKNK